MKLKNPQEVAIQAARRATRFSLPKRADERRAAFWWALFIDALMEAPEVTDDER